MVLTLKILNQTLHLWKALVSIKINFSYQLFSFHEPQKRVGVLTPNTLCPSSPAFKRGSLVPTLRPETRWEPSAYRVTPASLVFNFTSGTRACVHADVVPVGWGSGGLLQDCVRGYASIPQVNCGFQSQDRSAQSSLAPGTAAVARLPWEGRSAALSILKSALALGRSPAETPSAHFPPSEAETTRVGLGPEVPHYSICTHFVRGTALFSWTWRWFFFLVLGPSPHDPTLFHFKCSATKMSSFLVKSSQVPDTQRGHRLAYEWLAAHTPCLPEMVWQLGHLDAICV